VSEFEAELRRRLSAETVDIYDIMCWFLDAINAQACADGGPEPDLSWFEREFLKNNMEYCREERMQRKTIWELLDRLAIEGPVKPDQPLLDVSDWSDVDLINVVVDDKYGDSAVAELGGRGLPFRSWSPRRRCIDSAGAPRRRLRLAGRLT
jgi:hypothetical protein